MIRLKQSQKRRIQWSHGEFSDASGSVAVGCSEKHFTSDKNLPGRDNQFALTAYEFKTMVANCQLAFESMTDHGDESLPCEADTINVYRGRWG